MGKRGLVLLGGSLLIFSTFFLTGLWADGATGDQWTVWAGSDGNDLEVFYAKRVGGQWTQAQRLNDNNSVADMTPAVVVDQKGRAFVAWVRVEGEKREIYCSEWNGKYWSTEELVGDSTDVVLSEPTVALGDKGEIWVVASGVKEGEQSDIYWAHRTSEGWSPWSQLNERDRSPDLDPTILAFENKIWVVWAGFDGVRYQLFGKIWNGEKWSQEDKIFHLLSDPFAEFPSLTVEEGNPSLIFYQNGKAHRSLWGGTNWLTPVTTVIPIEATFIDLWKNQGVYRTQLGWFENEMDRGSLTVLLQTNSTIQGGGLALKIKKFFDLSGGAAWAAVNANVYIAFGDSITQGYPQGSFVPSLNSKINAVLGPSTVINRGVGGETTSGGVNRIGSVLNADNAEFILIMEGTNDVGLGRDLNSAVFNLGVMIDKSKSFGTRPIISTLTPRRDIYSGGAEYMNDRIRPMAGEKGIPLADNFAAVNAHPDPASLYTDHIHFNASGNEVLAQSWFGAVRSAKGGGGGDGGGGCGSIRSGSSGPWSINLEPIFFLVLIFFVAKAMRGFFRP